MQLFKVVIVSKEAAVEWVEQFAAKGPPLIHCLEQMQHVLPNRRTLRIDIWVIAAINEEVLKQLRREGESLPHVLAKEDEDAAVEDFLSKANETPARTWKARCAVTVSFEQGQIETLAKFLVLTVERVFEFPIPEALLSNQTNERRSTGS